MTKFKGKDYKDLSISSKTTLDNKLNQLKQADLTISEALHLTPLELGNILGITPRKDNYTDLDIEKSAKAYQRVYKQIRGTQERRENTITNVYDKTYKAGFSEIQKKQLKVRLTKIAGNTFTEIAKKLQDLYKLKDKANLTAEQQSYTIADNLLKIREIDARALDDDEREILDTWS